MLDAGDALRQRAEMEEEHEKSGMDFRADRGC